MKGKNILSIVLAGMMAVMSVTGCAGGPKETGTEKDTAAAAAPAQTAEGKNLRVAIVASGTFGTQAFVDVALAGCQRAEQELGIKLDRIENCQAANAVDTLRNLAETDIDMFIMTSGVYVDTIRQLSGEFPDKVFVSADMSMELIPNVISVGYREQEAAFLAGAIAAEMTKTNKIAFIGGQPGGSMDRFEVGYSCGAKYAKPDIEASVAYVGNFNDVNKAKELAAMLYDQGNDWLVPAAGASNLGIFQASQEQGEGKYTLGAADGQFHLMPEKIVASQVKKIDNVCYMIIEDMLNDRAYVGQTLELGLKEDGVGILYNPDETIAGIIPDETRTRIDELTQEIIDGKIAVPKSTDELAAFVYPAS